MDKNNHSINDLLKIKGVDENTKIIIALDYEMFEIYDLKYIKEENTILIKAK